MRRIRQACQGAIIVAVALLNMPVAARQGRDAAPQDFPSADRSIWDAERRALLHQAAEEHRPDRKDVADVIAFLAQSERGKEAIALAREAVRVQPAQIRSIVKALNHPDIYWGDRQDGRRDELIAALSDIREAIRNLPREDAARAARALLDLETMIQQNSPEWRGRGDLLTAFIKEYSGTTEADLAQLDSMMDRSQPVSERSAALEKYAADHPASVAGAKALYLLADTYGNPIYGTFGARDASDPTDRFLKRMKVVATLESGNFPPCEWVDRAADLPGFFYFPESALPSESFSRVVAAYEAFLLPHISADAPWIGSPETTLGYLLTERLPELFVRNSDSGGMARLFDDLEREGHNPEGVRYVRAIADATPRSQSEGERAESLVRSNRALDGLSRRGGERSRQRALSTLASQLFQHREYSAAIDAYRRYLAAFPESDWAWVAAIRIGQAQMELRDFAAARDSLRLASETYSTRTTARFVALAFAAQASGALGDFEGEAATLKETLEAWDPTLGPDFSFGYGESRILTTNLRRDTLSARLTTVSASLARSVGADIENARWLADHADWDGALAVLARLAKEPGAAADKDLLALTRRAHLEHALAAPDVPADSADDPVDRELQALTVDAQDFNAVAARIVRAAFAGKRGKTDDAKGWLREGLETWRKNQPLAGAPAKGSLAEDVLAIRDVVFRPLGGGFFAGSAMKFDFPATLPPYLVVRSSVIVKLPSGRSETVAVNRPTVEFSNTLFLDDAQAEFLFRLMRRIGAGTRGGPPADLTGIFGELLPVREAGWVGWIFIANPTIQWIKFSDDSRTKATADLDFGGHGVEVLLEKRDGKWVFTAFGSYWEA